MEINVTFNIFELLMINESLKMWLEENDSFHADKERLAKFQRLNKDIEDIILKLKV